MANHSVRAEDGPWMVRPDGDDRIVSDRADALVARCPTRATAERIAHEHDLAGPVTTSSSTAPASTDADVRRLAVEIQWAAADLASHVDALLVALRQRNAGQP